MELLFRPYPLEAIRLRFMTATVVSLFVYGLLALMQPFGLNLLQVENGAWIVLGYGLLVWVQLMVYYVLMPMLLPSVFDEDTWKTYKEMVWLSSILVLIGASVAGYEDLITTRPLTFQSLAESMGKTFIIGVIPVMGMTFLNRYRVLRNHLAEAKQIHGRLIMSGTTKEPYNAPQTIELTSNNKGEKFEGMLNDLLFIAALGNYVEIHYLKDGKPLKTILRTTLNAVNGQLSAHAQLFRSHRAYIINLKQVKDVDGNAGGYDVSFGLEGLTAPVAKRKTTEFQALMNGE